MKNPPPIKITAKKRYYLHYKLRKSGYVIKRRTVEVPAAEFECGTYLKPIVAKWIAELQNAGYGIQSTIV
jgi:hypothetical protein